MDFLNRITSNFHSTSELKEPNTSVSNSSGAQNAAHLKIENFFKSCNLTTPKGMAEFLKKYDLNFNCISEKVGQFNTFGTLQPVHLEKWKDIIVEKTDFKNFILLGRSSKPSISYLYCVINEYALLVQFPVNNENYKGGIATSFSLFKKLIEKLESDPSSKIALLDNGKRLLIVDEARTNLYKKPEPGWMILGKDEAKWNDEPNALLKLLQIASQK
jgi:hypothetical protein